MTIESLLFSIEGSLAVGLAVGLLVGFAFRSRKLGCIILLAVPVAMLFYVGRWQGQHPENLRSTSALDFMFGPLWPSLGALAGFYAGQWVRSRLS
jgi:hypothetical protein